MKQSFYNISFELWLGIKKLKNISNIHRMQVYKCSYASKILCILV